MAYLLLEEEPSANHDNDHSLAKPETNSIKPSHSRFVKLANDILEFLITNASALQQAYFPSMAENLGAVNRDVLKACVSFCTVGYSIFSHSKFKELSQGGQLRNSLDSIRTGIKHCILHHHDRQELLKGALEAFAVILPPVDRLGMEDDLPTNGAISMSQGLDHEFWDRVLHCSDANVNDPDQVGMDFDEEFDSQRSKRSENISAMVETHSEVAASTNHVAFRVCIAAKVCLMSNVIISDLSLTRAASLAVDYLTSLQGQEFLACRTAVLEVFSSRMDIAEDDAMTLLQYLAEVLLRSYEHERSEVSMGTILDVMTCLCELWTANESSEITNMGEVLYSWFIDTALKNGITSPHVHIRMSAMLQKIIKICPEYGKDVGLRSARTCLFEILRDGNIVVKFRIGSRLAQIFRLFILKEHENILEDVISNLPEDSTWIEGIALRLFILSHLAASWSTLLRRCIYAMLECPRHIPRSTGYATNCLHYITICLRLPKSEDLFKLFVPQIFYTWFETESLNTFPHAIFGYDSLPDLLRDVIDELVGQIIMRGKNDEANQLSEELNEPFEKLLLASFSKASAYCIARDVAVPSTTDTPGAHAESRMRSIVGKDKYNALVFKHFSKILAILFKTTDPEAEMEKGFQKHGEVMEAHSIYAEILSKSGPDKALPTSQQPSFKAKYLLDEIDYLCRRTNHDAGSLWTPELYVFIFREILDCIHKALGSLHACLMLRRIRALFSVAGKVALEQYPLEMALQALKPHTTDPQCAEEAIGLMQYLLEHGALYLRETPSFLAGHAVSTLTSMKAFFETTQDSTMQESEFLATMSRAQAFHKWFSAFLQNYESPNLSEDSTKNFKIIVNAASHIQTGGNARIGTYESDLLLEVLEDQRSERNLLDQSCRDSILRFLCGSFEVPFNYHDDVLGSDENASKYASTVWKTIQRSVSSPSYRLWAGRVLGRAYAGAGLVDQEMIKEMSSASAVHLVSDQMLTTSSSSRSNLLRLLCDVLRDENSRNVGMAEATLRSIVTKTHGTEDSLECDKCLPSSLKRSLLWSRSSLPDVQPTSSAEGGLQGSATFGVTTTAQDWIQNLCIALVLTTANDPILSELAPVMLSIDGLAEKAFPYVLHMVLLEETNGHQNTRRTISERCQQMFQECAHKEDKIVSSVRILLQAVLYLRTQPLPNETTKDDRSRWLEIDYRDAAAAAINCSMYKTALLFLDLDFSGAAKLSRRSSAIKIKEPSELLLAIYEKIDEQDAFYGVQQPSSLSSMMAKLEYEHAGFKSLSFRGAHYDGQLRSINGEHSVDEESMVRALDNLDLNGLSQSVLSKMTNAGPIATESILRTARKLEQWDISAPTSHVSSASTIFRVFQGINNATDSAAVVACLNAGFSDTMDRITRGGGAKSAMHEILSSLAILTEADEIFSSRRCEHLLEVVGRFEDRNRWMHSER